MRQNKQNTMLIWEWLLMIELYDYQIKQVQEGLQGKNINLSEVGTGKTFVGLELFNSLRKERGFNKLLIICLASKVSDFASDGLQVGLHVNTLDKGSKLSNELIEANNDTLQAYSVSFESSWRVTALKSWVDSKTMILVDESHKLKSRSSKVGFYVKELALKSGFTYQMTATPITNGHYDEWFMQLVIAGAIPDNWKAFERKYCEMELQSIKVKGQTRYFNEIVGYKNTQELDSVVTDSAVFKKRDIAENMKPIFIDYIVKRPTMYNKIAKQRVLQLDDGSIKEYDSVSSVYHAQRQLASGAISGVNKVVKKDKIERVRDILKSAESERVTIFYNYNSDLFLLKEVCEKEERPYSMYNGSSHDLTAFKKSYNGVALVQYKSGATGKNDFVISSVGIFFSLPDGSSTYTQAVGRLNRIGQTKQPVLYNLICEKSVESKVMDCINQGIDITEDMKASLID